MMDNDNVEVIEVMMDNDNVEAGEVAMDDDNVEIVVMNGDEQVSDDDNFVGVFDLSPLYDIEGVEQIAPIVARLLVDRPAGVQHPLPEPHNLGALNYVCTYCRARHFKCEETSPNHFSTAVVGPYREREDHVENVDAGVQVPKDELLLEENIEVVEVMMGNDNVEVVEVMMDNDNF
ncbi:uncharacterized protein LOC100571214 [Acyrthosiphon pisum]|uniref:Uncharacterized protein n=1 Tax=Acyrthosiphon pisum TaxID=7029 RepID=A0A8R2JWH9_ACYPI|nr:uncharacterized protein LOC100571214 [Acyrthosiphon pisum]